MLAVEKIVTSKLMKPGANKRIATVDRHVGIVSSVLVSILYRNVLAISPTAGLISIDNNV